MYYCRQQLRYASFHKKKDECTSVKQYSSGGGERYRIYAFGLMEHGALGLKKEGSVTKRYIAKPVRHLFAEENCVVDVCCGFGFTAFAVNSKDTFKVYGCGVNTDKQISGEHYATLTCPYPINLGIQNPQTRVKCMSAGRAHLAVVTDTEGVFLIGSNCYGQCGRPIDSEERRDGAFVVNCIKSLDNEPIEHVSCGQDHTLFLTCSGKVFACGWGADGQTGLGHTKPECCPTRLGGDIEGQQIVQVAGRSDTVLALSKSGQVFGWGNNEYGQLSSAEKVEQINCPKCLTNLSKIGNVKDIAAGGTACMVVNECGTVYVWGYGILGAGPQLEKTYEPIALPKPLFGGDSVTVEKVECGLTYMAAITSCSHLYTWGNNKSGALGVGHIKDQYFPYKVALSAQAVKVSCGVDHTMVLCKPF
ncbi:hypothetical protein O3M35_009954 [Rhynocoris fuscipes]|uniref:RCC1-like domain-containing protein n=1 Tax=Rhynocoris fuscipes TaxID=488301 RepID=A0AAW1D0T9_9HEMI